MRILATKTRGFVELDNWMQCIFAFERSSDGFFSPMETHQSTDGSNGIYTSDFVRIGGRNLWMGISDRPFF